VHKSLASFKADFCNALKQVEQTDRKSKLEAQEAIKQYPEIVKESAELGAANTFPNTSEHLMSVFSTKAHQDVPKGCNERKTHRSHPVLESKLLNVHFRCKVINGIDIK